MAEYSYSLSKAGNGVIVIAQRIAIWTVAALPFFVAVLSSMLTLMCGLASAQEASTISKVPPPRGKFYDICPPGRRIQFSIGSLSLFVEPRWLALQSAIPLSQRLGAECPSQPVKVDRLYFHNTILDAANIPAGLGQPFFFLVIRDEATLSPKRMTKLGIRDAPPLKQTAHPYVEDITDIVFGARPPPQPSRVYRVVYPGVDDKPPTFVEVSCGGDQRQPKAHGLFRECFTPVAYSYLGAITVDYKFEQDRLPIVEAEKDAPTMLEPEGVLAFDSRLRVWLDSLTKEP